MSSKLYTILDKITDRVTKLPIANGGTNATTVAEARNNLGLGNTDGALPLANGGTGATTAAAARTALELGTVALETIETATSIFQCERLTSSTMEETPFPACTKTFTSKGTGYTHALVRFIHDKSSGVTPRYIDQIVPFSYDSALTYATAGISRERDIKITGAGTTITIVFGVGKTQTFSETSSTTNNYMCVPHLIWLFKVV